MAMPRQEKVEELEEIYLAIGDLKEIKPAEVKLKEFCEKVKEILSSSQLSAELLEHLRLRIKFTKITLDYGFKGRVTDTMVEQLDSIQDILEQITLKPESATEILAEAEQKSVKVGQSLGKEEQVEFHKVSLTKEQKLWLLETNNFIKLTLKKLTEKNKQGQLKGLSQWLPLLVKLQAQAMNIQSKAKKMIDSLPEGSDVSNILEAKVTERNDQIIDPLKAVLQSNTQTKRSEDRDEKAPEKGSAKLDDSLKARRQKSLKEGGYTQDPTGFFHPLVPIKKWKIKKRSKKNLVAPQKSKILILLRPSKKTPILFN